MRLWKKIEEFVEQTYTDKKTGNLFLAAVLALGAVGVIFCLAWFAVMCMNGIPLWALIFDGAIILFCAWAIIWGIIPMAKEAFGWMNKEEENE